MAWQHPDIAVSRHRCERLSPIRFGYLGFGVEPWVWPFRNALGTRSNQLSPVRRNRLRRAPVSASTPTSSPAVASSRNAYPCARSNAHRAPRIPIGRGNTTLRASSPARQRPRWSAAISRLATQNHGYPVPPQPCTYGAATPNYYRPPELDNQLRKPRRSPLAAVNCWIRTATRSYLEPSTPPTAGTARAVNTRLSVLSTKSQQPALTPCALVGFRSIDPGGPNEGAPSKSVVGTTPDLLAEILYQVVAHKLVPILVFNDSTGQHDPAWATQLAKHASPHRTCACSARMRPTCYLASPTNSTCHSKPSLTRINHVINIVRKAGLNLPVVVTANEWGQGCD